MIFPGATGGLHFDMLLDSDRLMTNFYQCCMLIESDIFNTNCEQYFLKYNQPILVQSLYLNARIFISEAKTV